MVRNAMFTLAFGALALTATTAFAQDPEGEPKPLRFDPMVKVMGLEATGGLKVTPPGATEAVDAVAYKAYPYGSAFEAAPGVQFRVLFSNLTYAVVRGPARFVPRAADAWRKVTLDATLGDYNLRVDERALPGQFTLKTPLGAFTSMSGMAKLHLGDIKANAPVDEEDFAFRTLSGSAVFQGLHYTMSGMTQANAFSTVDAANLQTSEVTGRLGEVKMDLPSGNGATTPFSLTPGAQVKITRAKAAGSDRWVVSVLTLYANGQAKNYFCYVEGRGEGYSTGELIAEVLPEDAAALADNGDGTLPAEGAANAAQAEDDAALDYPNGDIPDELSNFDDGQLF